MRLLIVGVDVEAGDPAMWDARPAGVPLTVATVASCAVTGFYPLIRIGTRRCIDGGNAGASNAGLAASADMTVLVDPLMNTSRSDTEADVKSY
ncbi:hypothetical protein [Actinomadura fibrosa]|uniref:PNPLA domain-containing protein n=1 Tax=Actinomadura fibrosa TaxID=111802 RepID=A0ABW2XN51_9ACTN|nr:hypothetical protein [Actinomadura fibrosa]